MTNKTELLPCPFCGSTALHYDNGYATCPKYSCPINGVVVKNEDWNTRAAPPEDVRAVVDEPVHQVRSHGSCCWEDISGESLESCRCQPEHYEIRELYRHPQRPMVLPERELYSRYLRGVIPENRFEVEAYKDGWNSCIDRIAELNK